MEKYELIKVDTLFIDTEELITDVIEHISTRYEPKEYGEIDDIDIYDAIEESVGRQQPWILRSDYDYDNWSETVDDIAYSMITYIDTQNIQHDLIPIIKRYIK